MMFMRKIQQWKNRRKGGWNCWNGGCNICIIWNYGKFDCYNESLRRTRQWGVLRRFCSCLQHEQCGASQIAGVNLQPLRNNPDGTFDISELQSKLRKDRDHEPISKLVLVENTIDGKIVPQDWIDELVIFCKEHNLKLHMDGARLWNASVGSGRPAKEIVSGFDSVTFCLSKGLGAPVGSRSLWKLSQFHC